MYRTSITNILVGILDDVDDPRYARIGGEKIEASNIYDANNLAADIWRDIEGEYDEFGRYL